MCDNYLKIVNVAKLLRYISLFKLYKFNRRFIYKYFIIIASLISLLKDSKINKKLELFK